MSYDPTFGDGYDSTYSPITLNDDGTITATGYTPTPPQGHTSSSGIGISPPSPDDDMLWNPIVPEVAPPTAMFDSVSYEGYEVQFINESLGNVETISWDFGDGQTSTKQHPLHVYATEDDFLVILTVGNGGGQSIHTSTVEAIAPSPEIGFNFAIGGYTAYFTNLSNTSGYLWDFGDGQTSTDKHPKHTYATTGEYTVTLTTGGLTLQKTIKVDVEILLEWEDNSGDEEGFRIERSPNGSTDWEEVSVVGADITSYGVTLAKDGIDSAEMNFFRVYAYIGETDSDNPTNTASVKCGG